MKTKLTTLLLTLFSVGIFYAQEKEDFDPIFTDSIITILDENENKTYTYYKTIDSEEKLDLAANTNYEFLNKFIVYKDFLGKDDFMIRKNKLFNEAMLNILFAEEVSSYIGESKDLSLKKSYAVLSTEDKSLFLGHSFVLNRKLETQKLTHLLTVGVKTKLDDKFSSFLSKDRNLEDEIGITGKYTWIGRGIINYGNLEDPTISNRIKSLNEDVVLKNEILKIDKSIKDSVYYKEIADIRKIYGPDTDDFKAKEKSFYKNKYDSFYQNVAEEQIKRLRTEKLYNHLWDHYAAFEVFIPLSRNFYNVYNTPTATKEEEPFYPWKINAGYTSFWKFSSGQTYYLSGSGSIFNNNTIVAELSETIKSTTLQTPNTLNPNMVSTSSVYLGEYDRFVTGSVKAEVVSYIFFKGKIGFSGALEQFIGEQYHPFNWKLGIPVSLKDKQGKPTVNFELQWKRLNGEHLVGIGVGFAFGKFIK
ncbi:hypothetical protein [Olleya sp. Bg11-27]|uniref:hypothetical protein n=1 Tax=Olleya sp. Bg11-27 TaxID=2058135 RepID=UPI000C315374|nr:hypothetical protein [Olleya sp. Bg11-27]AUC76140.1 hypothetical protein CW732_10880 [Olleya sp. Bg11-27]